MSEAVITRKVADELAWSTMCLCLSSRPSCLSVQSLLYSLVTEKMYQKVPSGTSSSTASHPLMGKCAQIGSFIVDSVDHSPKMKRKNSYRKFFKGKMTKNECVLKSDSFPSIGSGGVD